MVKETELAYKSDLFCEKSAWSKKNNKRGRIFNIFYSDSPVMRTSLWENLYQQA